MNQNISAEAQQSAVLGSVEGNGRKINKEVVMDIFDKLFVVLLILCPILERLKGPVSDAGNTVLIAFIPYICFKLLKKDKIELSLIVFFILSSVYEIFNHGIEFMEFARSAVFLLYMLAAANHVIDTKFFVKAVKSVAVLASIILIVQYVFYYLLGFHIQVLPTSWLLQSSEHWIGLIETGRISIQARVMDFYRPSAFFMEPSHMAIYCFPALTLSILSPKMDMKEFITTTLITLGILLSTSGMGIGIAVGLWGVYLALYVGDKGHIPENRIIKMRPVNWIFVGIMLATVVVMYFTVGVFRNSINRIFVATLIGGPTAIGGRIEGGLEAMSTVSGKEFWFGVAKMSDSVTGYLSGFFFTFYKQGFIGMVLSYLFYLKGLFTLRRGYFWLSFLVIGVSFFSVQTRNIAHMLLYCIMLIDGFFELGYESKINLPIGKIFRRKTEGNL